ncbi:MAG: hypothetical protein RMN25_13220 [Anaerolineae bacterium]|nr:hypothetical protein [Thermoflexales bacterium]MDW8408734.1 hypothetical protein [Anaerolineae bacterium]
MIKPEHIVAIDVAPAELDVAQTRRLAMHTANTWQADRSLEERLRDTMVGKAAELAWQQYLTRQAIAYRIWDDIRQDGGVHHAPVDGFIARADEAEFLAGDMFARIAREWQEGAQFRRGFLAACERRGIFGFEVKSTRIAPRHVIDGQINYAAILDDDFLVYPLLRAGLLDEVTRQELNNRAQRAAAAERTPYILVRAYIDMHCSTYRVYLIGYITRTQFFQSDQLRVTAMPQPNKSERAIYYAVPLRLGQPLSALRQALGV